MLGHPVRQLVSLDDRQGKPHRGTYMLLELTLFSHTELAAAIAVKDFQPCST